MADTAQGTVIYWDTGTPEAIGKLVSVEFSKPAPPVDVSDLDATEHVYLAGLPDDEMTLTVIGTADGIDESDVGILTFDWADGSADDEFDQALCTSKTKTGGVAGRIETRLIFKLTEASA